MGKGKTVLIVVGAILAFVLIGAIFAYFSLFSDNVEVATLSQGSAEYNRRGSWEPANIGTKLQLSDSVRTTDDGAMLTFYESIIVELEPGAEISIEELSEDKVKIKQEKGTTWNKFTSILGIQNYEVETPTTVATVRGTEFGVDADNDEITVLEGNVGASMNGKDYDIKPFQRLGMVDGEMRVGELTLEQKKKMLPRVKKTLENIKNIREQMIERKRPMIEAAMKKYDVDEGHLRDYMEKIDRGEVDDAELIEKSPVKTPEMYRFKKMNDEVKKQMALIRQLEEE